MPTLRHKSQSKKCFRRRKSFLTKKEEKERKKRILGSQNTLKNIWCKKREHEEDFLSHRLTWKTDRGGNVKDFRRLHSLEIPSTLMPFKFTVKIFANICTGKLFFLSLWDPRLHVDQRDTGSDCINADYLEQFISFSPPSPREQTLW